MKQYLLPIIAALLLGACTTYTYTPTLFRQERILGFYGEKAGTGSSTKPQMYIITNKNEYSIALPPVFQAAQQAGIFNDAADTNWQQIKLQNREALLAQYRLATPITLEIHEEGRTQRSVKPLDGSSIGMLLLSPILVPAILFTGGLKPSR